MKTADKKTADGKTNAKKNMKDKKAILRGILIFTALSAFTLILVTVAGRRPFRRLDASEIVFAKVWLGPPDITLQITDLDTLAAYMRKLVIYQADDSYQEYNGQGVIFTLTMKDGSQTSVMTYSPFLVIDGAGYRTRYAPCNALHSYANRLLSSREDAVIILEEPPTLAVISDNTSHEALRGTYSWLSRNPDGTDSSTEVDSLHPLECRNLMPLLETGEDTAVLRFLVEPDEIISVRCWSDTYLSDASIVGEAVPVSGNQISLKPGACVYEVTAKWNTEDGWGGTAHYCFYIAASP